MHPIYGDKCFARPAVHVYCKMFAHGQGSAVDEKQLGRPVVSATATIITAVDFLIWSDHGQNV